jgi:hypothetical protein
MRSIAINPLAYREDSRTGSHERGFLRFALALAIAALLVSGAVSAAFAQDAYGGITGSNYLNPYYHHSPPAR